METNEALSFLTKINNSAQLSAQLKVLSQRERRILILGIQALLHRKTLPGDFLNNWDSIKRKISTTPSNPNPRPIHLIVRVWKGFLNLMGWRTSSTSLLASIRSITTQVDKDVNYALKKIQENHVTDDENIKKIEQILRRNPSLASDICQLKTFSNEDDPTVKVTKNLIEELSNPSLRNLIPFLYRGPALYTKPALYTGSAWSDLPAEIQVVVNLGSPYSVPADGIEVHNYNLFDFDLKQMTEEEYAAAIASLERAILQVFRSLKEKRSVFVHCMEKEDNRTLTVVAAALSLLTDRRIEDVFTIISQKPKGSLPPSYLDRANKALQNYLDRANKALQNISMAMARVFDFSRAIREEIWNIDLAVAILHPNPADASDKACHALGEAFKKILSSEQAKIEQNKKSSDQKDRTVVKEERGV